MNNFFKRPITASITAILVLLSPFVTITTILAENGDNVPSSYATNSNEVPVAEEAPMVEEVVEEVKPPVEVIEEEPQEIEEVEEVEAEITLMPEPQIEEVIQTWSYSPEANIAVTNTNVVESTKYEYPGNDLVSVTFTSLPDVLSRSTLTIKEVTLSPAQIEKTGALSSTAYEITTGMKNGTFTYDLTLPTSESNVEVKYAANTNKLDTAEQVTQRYEVNNNYITITGLDHFTVFVVTNPADQASCDAVELGSVSGSSCFATIQEALDAADVDGSTPHTITIGAGTYNESLTIKSGDITLQGQGDTTIISPAINTTGITVNSGNQNVTIQNLRIDNQSGDPIQGGVFVSAGANGLNINNLTIDGNNGGQSARGGIRVSGSIDDVSITDNTVENFTVANSRGIVIWDNVKTNITITGNTVRNINCCGIELQDGTASNFNISNNILEDMSDSSIAVINTDDSAGGNNIISGNTIVTGMTGRFGIEVKGSSVLTVSNNTITGSAPTNNRDRAGIAVGRINHTASHPVDCAENITVTGNVISNITQPAAGFSGFGISLSGDNITASGNTLNNNDIGINVQQGFTGSQGDADAGDNYFGRDICASTSNVVFNGNSYTGNGIDNQAIGGATIIEELDAPTLLTPADGTIFKASDLPASQTWTSVLGAAEYDYQSCSSDPALNSNECPAADVVYTTTTASTSRNIGTSAATGEYWWQVRAVNGIGNESEWSASSSFEVDKVKPTIVVDSPADNFLTASDFDITVTATDGESGLANIVINLKDTDGSQMATCYNTNQGGAATATVSCTVDVSVLPDGIYSYKTNTLDNAGNLSNTITQYFEVDAAAPDVEITAPADGDILTGSVDVYGTVTDDNPLRYYTVVRDSSNTVVAGPGTVNESNSFTDELLFSWDTTLVPDGEYTIWLAARDSALNRDSGSEDEITVSVNNIPPAKPVMNTIYDTDSGNVLGCSAFTNEANITIEWLANTESDLDYYWFGTKFNPRHRKVLPPTTTYSGTITPNNNPYFYTIIAVDVAGNESEISDPCGDLILDQTKPVIAVDSPVDGIVVNSNFDIQVTATDSGDSGLDRVVINVKDTDGSTNLFTCLNESQGGIDAIVTGCNLDISTLTEGETYFFRTNTVDRAGNVSNTIQQSFTVDTVAPDVEINSPEDGDILSGSVDVYGTVTDENPLRYYTVVRDSTNAVVAGPGTVYEDESITNELLFTWDTTLVPDGIYTIRLEARDQAGNKDAGSVDVITVTVDNTVPTVNGLADDSFNEGSTLPSILVEGDDVNLNEFCVEITASPIGAISETCLADDGSGEWDLSVILNSITGSTILDTSIYPEGDYEISYYVSDEAGNVSDTETVTYTIVNVAPLVTFGSTQTINEGTSASFTGSFTDPSVLGDLDSIFDDSDWTATIDYGDGSAATDLGSFTTEGSITIPSHTYSTNGSYTATLEVCESDNSINTNSEFECSSETVTVTVSNVAPSVFISADPNASVLSGSNILLTANIAANTLPGNQIVSYLWSGDSVCSVGATTQSIAINNIPADSYTCNVTVTDVDGDTATALITVSGNNLAPSVVLIATPGTQVSAGTTVTLQGNILGGDSGFTYTYSGDCFGSGTDAGGLVPSTTVPNTPGNYFCRIDITDANGDTAAAGVSISVNSDASVLGVGSGEFEDEDGDIEGEEDDTEDSEDDEGDVLGEDDGDILSCDEKQIITGTIYVDKDEDGVLGEGDELSNDVKVSIYYFDGDSRRLLSTVTTNGEGVWEAQVCPGNYEIEVEDDSIPSGTKLENKDSKDVSVDEDGEVNGIDFVLVEDSSIGAILPIGIGLFLLLLVLLILWLSRRARESQLQAVE